MIKYLCSQFGILIQYIREWKLFRKVKYTRMEHDIDDDIFEQDTLFKVTTGNSTIENEPLIFNECKINENTDTEMKVNEDDEKLLIKNEMYKIKILKMEIHKELKTIFAKQKHKERKKNKRRKNKIRIKVQSDDDYSSYSSCIMEDVK